MIQNVHLIFLSTQIHLETNSVEKFSGNESPYGSQARAMIIPELILVGITQTYFLHFLHILALCTINSYTHADQVNVSKQTCFRPVLVPFFAGRPQFFYYQLSIIQKMQHSSGGGNNLDSVGLQISFAFDSIALTLLHPHDISP